MLRIQAKPANTAQTMPLPKHAVLNSSLNTDNSRLLNSVEPSRIEPDHLTLSHRLAIHSLGDTIAILLHGLGNIRLGGQ
jgi:hypothetical protein